MPKQDYQEPEMFAPDERQIVDEAEIPNGAFITETGDVLVPVDDDEDAEFVMGDDGYVYPIDSGIAVEEFDEADYDEGYGGEGDFDYDDEGTSEPTDYED